MNDNNKISMNEETSAYIRLLFQQTNERLSTLDNKIDKLNSKFYFYLGFASAVASVLSFLLNKFL